MIKGITLLLLLLFTQQVKSADGIAVIVNLENPILHVSQRALIDLYMGKYQAFDNGMPAHPVDLETGDDLKAAFYKRLTGRTLGQINAYRSRVKFSGKASSPISMPSSDAVIQAVKTDPLAIGYVWASEVNNQVKVVYTFDK
ncbi:hypothetical protein PALB_6410 [Pseudoalteromonas luteoviolacea B = ATCC 29581]|nr:hypothetical protein PALB_6410 [Pseudoalteromonas luteoviolacea B = ATCC 29581]